MANLKKQLIKKIIGLTSFGALLVAVIFGLTAKGTNFKTNQDNQPSVRENGQLEERLIVVSSAEIEQSASTRDDLLEEDETSLILKEYSEAEAEDCMFVGCGGFF
jgi:hypothetical protein